MQKLEILRKKIDLLDNDILKLFSKRFEIVADIGAIKKENGIQVLDENRWKEVLKKVTTKGKEFGLTEEFVIYIWEKIHKESQKIEK